MRASISGFLFISLSLYSHIVGDPSDRDAEGTSSESKSQLPTTLLEELQGNSAYNAIHQMFQFLNTLGSKLQDMNERLISLEDVVFPNRTENVTDSGNTKPELDISALLKTLLEEPKAKLYSEENYTGISEDYAFLTTEFEGGCLDLKDLRRKVKSVDTFGTCIRLFYGQLCIGWSLAVYPGSVNSDSVLNKKLSQVESIGPCLSDEFEHATFTDADSSIGAQVEKSSSDVPDMIEICSLEKFYKATRPLEIPKLLTHLVGPHNRIELLVALIHPTLLNITHPQTEGQMESRDFYKSLEKHPGDVLGHGIPALLGGPTNESFNIFPQKPQGREDWLNITSGIRSMIMSEQTSIKVRGTDTTGPEILAQVALNFMYHNESSSRPYVFYYWVHLRSKRLFYGRILN
ncbi:unnamed protein product [Allacma fusca]|uniref:Uncharacterized protein n=1 Tax=Allacma fusca TaxID=39272 RepID=A0A8J2NKD6_9HEXA|nr:unnamed protein product [Allacma fusca]